MLNKYLLGNKATTAYVIAAILVVLGMLFASNIVEKRYFSPDVINTHFIVAATVSFLLSLVFLQVGITMHYLSRSITD